MNDVPDHVLLGDFNALRVDDYSAAQWASLCEFAAHAGWEKRQEACYQLMMQHKYRQGRPHQTDLNCLRCLLAPPTCPHLCTPLHKLCSNVPLHSPTKQHVIR